MPNSIYNNHNPLGVKYLTRLRIGFSHLKENKFKHNFRLRIGFSHLKENNFQDLIDPICSCSSAIETTIYYFLHRANFDTQRQTLFDKIATIDANILTKNKDSIVNIVLFGKPNSENSFNKAMLNVSIEFILSTEIYLNAILMLMEKWISSFFFHFFFVFTRSI